MITNGIPQDLPGVTEAFGVKRVENAFKLVSHPPRESVGLLSIVWAYSNQPYRYQIRRKHCRQNWKQTALKPI